MKNCIYCLLFLLATFICGCGHTQAFKVGLLSFGEWEGKAIPAAGDGKVLSGEDCGHQQRLSTAVRNALKETAYNTLVDAEVTSTTGLFVGSNCIKVKGNAVNSKTLTAQGGQ